MQIVLGYLHQQQQLYTIHYHKINVFDQQDKISSRNKAKAEDILEIPIADRPNYLVDDINRELENNAHSILVCVERWIDHE